MFKSLKNLFTVNEELKKDIDDFLKIEELDDLLRKNKEIREKYSKAEICKYTKKVALEEEQELANILFYPGLLPEKRRAALLNDSLRNRYGLYVMMAAVVGYQDYPAEDESFAFFLGSAASFFDHCKEMDEERYMISLITDRYLSSILSKKFQQPIEESLSILGPLLKNKNFKKNHHNLMVALFKIAKDIKTDDLKDFPKNIREHAGLVEKDLKEGKHSSNSVFLYQFIPNLNQLNKG